MCKNFLEVSSMAVAGGQFTITLADQPLNDGFVYTVRLNQTFPTGLTGKENVAFVINGVTIYMVDRRAREVLSERVLRYGERLRFVYTANGANALPVFYVFEGVVPMY